MASLTDTKRGLFEGRAALLVIDIQASTFIGRHQGDCFGRVIEDCVAGSGIEAHEAALKAMERLQTGARRSLAEVTTVMKTYEAKASPLINEKTPELLERL